MDRCSRPLGELPGLNRAVWIAAPPSPALARPWSLQNASIDLGGDAPAGSGGDSAHTVAALRQAACDLCQHVALSSLLPPDQASFVNIHFKARDRAGCAAAPPALCLLVGAAASGAGA